MKPATDNLPINKKNLSSKIELAMKGQHMSHNATRDPGMQVSEQYIKRPAVIQVITE